MQPTVQDAEDPWYLTENYYIANLLFNPSNDEAWFDLFIKLQSGARSTT
jgi:hypothetical protein